VIDAETIERLKLMRLSGMAQVLIEMGDPNVSEHLTAPEIIRLAVDREFDRRRNSKLHRLTKAADLADPHAHLGGIITVPGRTLDREFIARLATGNYLVQGQNVIIQGPTGAGKTYLACALGTKAVQQYKTVKYYRASDLFDQITLADASGTRSQLIDKLVRLDLLIIDDWFLAAPTLEQVRHLHTLIDKRTGKGSTIFATQLPPAVWHDRMEEKIVADAIIDRITAGSHTTVISCDESLRRHFANQDDEAAA